MGKPRSQTERFRSDFNPAGFHPPSRNRTRGAGTKAHLTVSLQQYVNKIARLNVNQAHGRASPHKICMLLALLDLTQAGGLTENRIRFLPPCLTGTGSISMQCGHPVIIQIQ